MKREMTEYGLAGDKEEFVVQIDNGNPEMTETIYARLIAFADERRSLAENRAASLRYAANHLLALADELSPEKTG